MKEILKRLNENNAVLGSFYFKGTENIAVFTENYNIPESRIKRVSLVLIQTMDALGGAYFDRFLLEGENNRIAIYKFDDGYYGVVFERTTSFVTMESLLKSTVTQVPVTEKKVVEERGKPEIKPKEKKEEKPIKREKPPEKVIEKEEPVLPEVFDKIKEILFEYLGDFSDTIFENQLVDTGIKIESATTSKVKKFCFALQKASAMLIGPPNAREMVDKLLVLLKSE